MVTLDDMVGTQGSLEAASESSHRFGLPVFGDPKTSAFDTLTLLHNHAVIHRVFAGLNCEPSLGTRVLANNIIILKLHEILSNEV
jgi:hypothetical protein